VTDLLPAPTATPVPSGRGRWRLQLLALQFAWGTTVSNLVVAEITDARSRRLETQKNGGSTLTFTLDGHSPSAALITELTQDVAAWRWDEQTGADVPMFRGVICQSQDTLSPDRHTLTITCHDYVSMLSRRLLTRPYSVTQRDQESIVQDLIYFASDNAQSSSGTTFYPGSYLPLLVTMQNPDGSFRFTASGQLRDRTYTPGSVIGDLLSNLAAVIGGFDYDVRPLNTGTVNAIPTSMDLLRIFYPRQGVTRSDVVLAYGSTGLGGVAGLSRSVNSADYSNHVRVLGQQPSDDDAPQVFSEQWNSDANNVTVTPVGLWSTAENDSDVTLQSTLDQNAAGLLARNGILVPSYSLTLAPYAYRWGTPNMGDTVPLVIRSGRLNVQTNVDVVGITYDIGDDGQEEVELTVGRPAVTFGDLFSNLDRTVNALARR
jgi:hypothetical protein